MTDARFRDFPLTLARLAGAVLLVVGCTPSDGTGSADVSSSSTSESSGDASSSSGEESPSSSSSSSGEESSSSSESTSSTSSESSTEAAEESTTSSSTSSSSEGSEAESGEDTGASGEAEASSESGGGGTFSLMSPAFEDVEGCSPDTPDPCALFPAEHVGTSIGGQNVSPELVWENPPPGTLSFAMAFHDLSNLGFMEAPPDDPFTHWVMWNIPGDYTSLPEGLPGGAMPAGLGPETQQLSFGANEAYAGSGARGNVYEFVLYALDTEVFTPTNTSSQDAVQSEIDEAASVLGTVRIRGRSTPQ